ncbi:hypothetical protein [Corallococcus silvisoli]|uniref:hypothetical protein n=1 Tax=Corallococcus silvisoli TaxID=2697031 RepID=UPI0013764FCA|nr:hypothetical protein [Corallococcus silvisoli]NBD13776.1 hypothetical protein [Corallococcus silvisoli]
MIHSDEKVLQMARSLLPSKNREAARKERAVANRAARREARRELETWLRYGDMEADAPPNAPWRKGEIELMVYGRRAADKVAPFIRWATARTRDMPHQAREGYVRGILPPGVIGRHAWSHLRQENAFTDPNEIEASREHWRYQRLRVLKRERREMADALRELLLQPEGLDTLNLFLRDCTALWASRPSRLAWIRGMPPPPPRPLYGPHDLYPFLDSIKLEARGASFLSWGRLESPASWVRLFLQRLKEHRGRLPALRATLEAEGVLTPLRPPWPPPQRAGAAGATWAPFSSLTTRVAP